MFYIILLVPQNVVIDLNNVMNILICLVMAPRIRIGRVFKVVARYESHGQ